MPINVLNAFEPLIYASISLLPSKTGHHRYGERAFFDQEKLAEFSTVRKIAIAAYSRISPPNFLRRVVTIADAN